MFQNEITWLKNNFGPGSITTDEFRQHDARIFDHWAAKMERNKARMLTRLYKCGGEFNPAVSRIQNDGTKGGFSEYDENKLKDAETTTTTNENEDSSDTTSVGAGRELIGQPSRGRRDDESSDIVKALDFKFGRTHGDEISKQLNVNSETKKSLDYELDQAKVDETLKHLDFKFQYPSIDNNPEHPNNRVRARGPLELRYDGKQSISRIRVVLQGFAMWAKNHISECEPKQPSTQMSRASKWFHVLGKKVVNKGKHVLDARRRGLPISRNN